MFVLIALVQKWLFLRASRREFLFPLITNTLNVYLTFFFFWSGCKYNHLGANKTFSFHSFFSFLQDIKSIQSIICFDGCLLPWLISRTLSDGSSAGLAEGVLTGGRSTAKTGSIRSQAGLEEPLKNKYINNNGNNNNNHDLMPFNQQKPSTNQSFPLSSRPSALVFPTLQGIITQAAAWRSPFTSKQSDSESFWQPVRSSDGSFRPESIKLPRCHHRVPAGRSEQ